MFNQTKINIALFALLACLWSASFVGIKAVVTVWPPLLGAAVRVGIGLLFIKMLITIKHKKTDLPFALRWKVWLMGLFAQALPFAFLFWGERLISPGLAGILNGTVPIWTFIFGIIFVPKLSSFSMLKAAGLLVGIFGIVIIFWPLLVFEHNTNTLIGAASILVMAMSYATGNLLNQYFLQGNIRIDFLTNIYHQHAASVTFLIMISLILEKWPTTSVFFGYSLPWIACLYLGIFATATAFMIYYHLIREWDGLRASSVMYIVPILGLVWDAVFFGNKPQLSEIYGVGAILVGVILIQLASLKKQTLSKVLTEVKEVNLTSAELVEDKN